jgi:UDP-N-acetylglucosamine 2-epimerase (non-hydrolysing)
MAPIVQALKEFQSYDVCVCVTAQHREMLDKVLELFQIVPDYDLDIMRADQDLTDITSRVLIGLRNVFRDIRPDIVLVHGDTTTTFSAALAAFYERISVGHVEAGLRTGNIYSPWPEEMNRRLTDIVSSIHFAPTESARQNLMKEGIDSSSIVVTGNTVVDALQSTATFIDTDSAMRHKLDAQFRFIDVKKRLIVVTGHRRENYGTGLENICAAIKHLATRQDVQIVYPMHLNPNVRDPVLRLLANEPQVHLIEPLDYLPFVYLMRKAYLILTDSGGIQEEAPSLGKPVLVMREETERQEAIKAGTAKLVGTDITNIVSMATHLLDDPMMYERMTTSINPYGDGKAATRIVAAIKERLCGM